MARKRFPARKINAISAICVRIWRDEEREAPEIDALIHSEWSEALEEARADRPLMWYMPDEVLSCCHKTKCGGDIKDGCCLGPNQAFFKDGRCPAHRKPEGAAFELIDGVIRILDYLGHEKAGDFKRDSSEITEFEDLYSDANVAKVPDKLPVVVAYLHAYTSSALFSKNILPTLNIFKLIEAMAVALSWVKKQGFDPLALLMEKHNYNKSRPYKHGKKF